MAYIINKANGQLLITLPDGTADGPDINSGLNVCDVNLFGKNYPIYGQSQNENFVRLMQHFANETAPSKPLEGQLWWDSAAKIMRVFRGNTFVTNTPVIVSNAAPTTSLIGEQWWNTVDEKFNVFDGTSWREIGPSPYILPGQNTYTVYDVYGSPHKIVQVTNGNVVMAIYNPDPEFTPNVAINGFTTIGSGLTLTANNSAMFNGTATNAQKLGNYPASNYIQIDSTPAFYYGGSFNSGKFVIGEDAAGTTLQSTSLNGGFKFYSNVNGIVNNSLTINGVNGLVYVSGDPTEPLGVATRQYVDAQINFVISNSVLSPVNTSLLGIPTAPTAAVDTNTTQIATTAFVLNQASNVLPLVDGVASIGTSNLYARADHVHPAGSLAAYAPLNSPTFTGTPTAPTPLNGDISANIATTEFVSNSVSSFATTAYVTSVEANLKLLPILTQTTSYTLANIDMGNCLEIDSATATSITVPVNSSVPIGVGSQIVIRQIGTGNVSIVADVGVTIRNQHTSSNIAGQWGSVSLHKRGTDEWVLEGNLG